MAAAASDNSGKWALGILGLSGLVFLFLWWKKHRKTSPVVQPANTPVTAPAPATVANRITTGYLEQMQSLNDDEVKKYAGWLDKANELAGQFSVKTAAKAGDVDQLAFNLKTVNGFSDSDFTAVVNAWKAARGITNSHNTDLHESMLSGDSNTQRNKFFNRLVTLNIA